jgi:hypothetical protein
MYPSLDGSNVQCYRTFLSRLASRPGMSSLYDWAGVNMCVAGVGSNPHPQVSPLASERRQGSWNKARQAQRVQV